MFEVLRFAKVAGEDFGPAFERGLEGAGEEWREALQATRNEWSAAYHGERSAGGALREAARAA